VKVVTPLFKVGVRNPTAVQFGDSPPIKSFKLTGIITVMKQAVNLRYVGAEPTLSAIQSSEKRKLLQSHLNLRGLG
jgi:hypothetical protein